jgi:putative addiction module component (TIGR02574 family)
MSPAQVAHLSPQERLALIEQLWESLDDADLAVTSAQQGELDRRLASHEKDPAAAVSWPDLRRELHLRQGK